VAAPSSELPRARRSILGAPGFAAAAGRITWPGRNSWLGTLLLIVVGLAALVPVAFIVFGSFNVAPPGQPVRLGLEGWRQAFSSSQSLAAIGYSLLLSVRIPVALLVGLLLSWLIVRARIPGYPWIEFGLWAAFFLPSLPVTLGWILLLDPNYGLLNALVEQVPFLHARPFNIFSPAGIVWVHLTTANIPVMVILLSPALRQFDAALEEAATMCGASRVQAIRRVVVPLLGPALVTALLAGFIRSLEAFEVEQLLGTSVGVQVYSTRIYAYLRQQPTQFAPAMALGTSLLGILFVLVLSYQAYTTRHRHATLTGRGFSRRPLALGKLGYVVSGTCSAFIAVSVVLPAGMLVIGSFMRGFGFFDVPEPFTTAHWTSILRDPVFLRAVTTSLQLCFGVAVLSVVLFSLLAYVLARTQLWSRGLIAPLAWLPWALPGVLLGSALLWLLVSTPGVNVLYGTVGGLLVALLIKEMPLATQILRAGFTQISEELEQAAAVCGAGWLRTYRHIMLPLLAPVLMSVFLLAFVSSLRDISTTILVASASARPWSILMMEYSMGGNLEGATVVATIVTVGAILVALGARRLGLRSDSSVA
jgi:iron(III) transport system permease protein